MVWKNIPVVNTRNQQMFLMAFAFGPFIFYIGGQAAGSSPSPNFFMFDTVTYVFIPLTTMIYIYQIFFIIIIIIILLLLPSITILSPKRNSVTHPLVSCDTGIAGGTVTRLGDELLIYGGNTNNNNIRNEKYATTPYLSIDHYWFFPSNVNLFYIILYINIYLYRFFEYWTHKQFL